MERRLPRHRARLLARRARRWASSPRRLAGSSDLYEHSGRRPVASINFVTAHDGFTLRDLVSYNEKHNDANGEDNNDGESHNRSWNHGVEGPTDDPEILALRARAAAQLPRHPAAQPGRRRCCCTATSSAAPRTATTTPTPRTPRSAGCTGTSADEPLVEFTAAVIRLRREHPTFRRKRFFTGSTVRTGDGERLNDIVWLHLDGRPMEDDDWDGGAQAIGMYLNGHGIAGLDARGGAIIDDHFLLYFNADGPADVTLPPDEYAAAWDVVIDTGGAADDDGEARRRGHAPSWTTRSVGRAPRAHARPRPRPDHSVAASRGRPGGQRPG